MSGPVRPPLLVELRDNTSQNRPVNTLQFLESEFTLTNTGTRTLVALSGGGGGGTIGGSIADTQVAFGTAADTIGGTANFTFDGDRTLKFQGATPRFYLGDTDVSTAENQMLLIMKSGSASFIYDRDDAASLNLGAGDTSNHIIIKPDGEIIINEGGNAEADVRMESDAYPNMFMLDAGFNKIFMGNGAVDNDADLGLVQISVGDSTQTALSLISTDADGTSAPTLQLFRNSASPVAGDQIGIIEFKGQNASGSKVLYASMNTQIDGTGSAFSSMQFEVFQGGSSRTNFRIRNSEVVINEDSIDCNFRVEGVGNQNLIQADAALNTIGINGVAQSDSDLTVYHTNSGATQAALRLVSTDGGANVAPVLDLYRDAGAADGDIIGAINFSGNNSTPAKINYIRIQASITDESATSADATLKFVGQRNNSEVEWMRLQGSGIVFNNIANSNLDFAYYAQGFSTSDALVHFDNSNAHVNIGTGLGSTTVADNNPLLQVQGSISGKMPVIIQNSDVTLTRDGLSGQTYVCTDGGTTALTMPLGALQGDYFYFVSSSGGIQIVVDLGTQTLNGGTTPITRSTNNEIYTVLCIEDNKFILSNPA